MPAPSTVSDKIYDPATDNVPTPVRINAVDYYVRKEPLLVAKMRDQQVKVKKRDMSVMVFPIDIFEIALLIHKEDRDSLKIGKADILAVARSYFKVSAPQTVSKTHAPSISDRGADMASRAVHSLLFDAARLEESREGGDSQVTSQLKALLTEMGFVGDPKTPAVVPYTLVLSASQLAEIHPKLSQFKAQFEKIVSHYQALTIES